MKEIEGLDQEGGNASLWPRASFYDLIVILRLKGRAVQVVQ